MLIVEKTSNGRTIITVKRDWHPGRISLAYTPRARSMTDQEIKWQQVLRKPSPV
jgi:hypothetical protein